MAEAEHGGVQRLAVEPLERVSALWGKPRRLGPEPGSIDRIAKQGMADMGEMDADLVRPPGLQPAGDQACRPQRFLEPPGLGGGASKSPRSTSAARLISA